MAPTTGWSHPASLNGTSSVKRHWISYEIPRARMKSRPPAPSASVMARMPGRLSEGCDASRVR